MSDAESAFEELFSRISRCSLDNCSVCARIDHDAEIVRKALKKLAHYQGAHEMGR